MQTDTSSLLYLHFFSQRVLLSATKLSAFFFFFLLLWARKMYCSISVSGDRLWERCLLFPCLVCHLISFAYVPGFFTCRDGMHAQLEMWVTTIHRMTARSIERERNQQERTELERQREGFAEKSKQRSEKAKIQNTHIRAELCLCLEGGVCVCLRVYPG